MPRKIPDRVIYTDLDGTLLDHETYSWKPAEPALREARKSGVPVVFCTSKTRAETEVCRKKLGNRHPFIVENGEAIFIPKGYFRELPENCSKRGVYSVKELGRPYKEIRAALRDMKKHKIRVRGFGDMDAREVSRLTGLSVPEARLARKREYDEAFILEEPKQELMLLDYIRKGNLQWTRGGRFFHLMSGGGKGIAVKALSDIYNTEAGKPVVSAGIGDSPNDLDMLRAVHIGFLVRNSEGRYASRSGSFIRIDRKGPEGWNEAVLRFLKETAV
jgi:mannosyl-3-phosphoglycerate phosphatase